MKKLGWFSVLWVMISMFVSPLAFAGEKMTADIVLTGDIHSLGGWYQRQGDEFATKNPWLKFWRDTCALSSFPTDVCDDDVLRDDLFRHLPVGTILTVPVGATATVVVAAPTISAVKTLHHGVAKVRKHHAAVSVEDAVNEDIAALLAPGLKQGKVHTAPVAEASAPAPAAKEAAAITPEIAPDVAEAMRVMQQKLHKAQNWTFAYGLLCDVLLIALVFMFFLHQKGKRKLNEQRLQSIAVARHVKRVIFEFPPYAEHIKLVDKQELPVVGYGQNGEVFVHPEWAPCMCVSQLSNYLAEMRTRNKSKAVVLLNIKWLDSTADADGLRESIHGRYTAPAAPEVDWTELINGEPTVGADLNDVPSLVLDDAEEDFPQKPCHPGSTAIAAFPILEQAA